jgi:hypothetical protein
MALRAHIGADGIGCAEVVYTTLAVLVEMTERYFQAANAIGRPLGATARYNFQTKIPIASAAISTGNDRCRTAETVVYANPRSDGRTGSWRHRSQAYSSSQSRYIRTLKQSSRRPEKEQPRRAKPAPEAPHARQRALARPSIVSGGGGGGSHTIIGVGF